MKTKYIAKEDIKKGEPVLIKEDGFWQILTKRLYEEITDLKIEKEKRRKAFVPPITLKDLK